jgi:RES domain-containing protein
MRLWRLSSARLALDFDGGYGLANDGRWNTRGRPLTYCATVPSLAALEKRVHVGDPALLPPLAMVAYAVPDDLALRRIELADLPADWVSRETETQIRGDTWLDAISEPLLMVPSAVVPLDLAADRNVLVNHRHPDTRRIVTAGVIAFTLDPRLFLV